MEVGLSYKPVIAIIQARMTSQRLPGKVLMALPFPDGKPLIEQLILKLRKCKYIDKIIVATPNNENQDKLIQHLDKIGTSYFQGDEEDVLSRFIGIIEKYQPKTVIRLTADNPFIDIPLLEKAIDFHIEKNAAYTLTQGLPYGMNMEIIDAVKLTEMAKYNNLSAEEKEHVTSGFKKHPGMISEIFRPFNSDVYSNIRVTIDTPVDYMRAAHLFQLQSSDGQSKESELEFIVNSFQKYPFIFSNI